MFHDLEVPVGHGVAEGGHIRRTGGAGVFQRQAFAAGIGIVVFEDELRAEAILQCRLDIPFLLVEEYGERAFGHHVRVGGAQHFAVQDQLAQADIHRRPTAAAGGHQAEFRRFDGVVEPVSMYRRVGEQIRAVQPLLLHGIPVLQAHVAQPGLGVTRVFHESDAGQLHLGAEGIDLQRQPPAPAGIDVVDLRPSQPRGGGGLGFAVAQQVHRLGEGMRRAVLFLHRADERLRLAQQVGGERRRRLRGVAPAGDPHGRLSRPRRATCSRAR